MPLATYRLQFGPQLGFQAVRELLPYLQSLGVTTVYLSPLLQSVRGGHGYDVTDPRRPNEALGTAADLGGLCDAAAAVGVDLLVDIVPNHMAASTENPFWRDVLEKGRASRFAGMFDIDWEAPEAGGRLVLPLLPASLDELVSAGEVGLEWTERTGELELVCGALRLPLSPWSYGAVLGPGGASARTLLARTEGSVDLDAPAADRVPEGLLTVLEAARALPGPDAATRDERERLEAATGTLKLRLAQAVRASPAAADHVRERLAAFGAEGASASGGTLVSALVALQPYRLLPWRSGSRIVNYRRFFDIADLVAVRQEEPGVFELTHGYLLELLEHPAVVGFRVDHVDGLNDPRGYLERLRDETGDALVVVEKILAEGERLPPSWPVDGTTGYEVSAAIDRLLVDGSGWAVLKRAYEAFAGEVVPPFRSLAADAKREVLETLFPQEVRTLARRLPGEPSRADGVEASAVEAEAAVVDVTAALRVYRTYFGDPASAESTRWLRDAAATLRRTGGRSPRPVREGVLRTIRASPGGGPELQWTERWQRLTGAAAAKGVEDTAMYRYPVLLSRNEVGSEPDAEPLDPQGFHDLMRGRHETGRGGLSATSTHDSKRDEDARGRLHVLSERAREWTAVRRRWHDLNAPLRRRVGPGTAPVVADEDLIYQSLVAVWPLEPRDEAAALERLCRYVVKALREAKRRTSWTEPSAEYEAAVEGFVRSALEPGHGFLGEVRRFVRGVAASGAVNSLAMVLLRAVVPGIPDTYQGTELWTLPRLVDPDNREAVDLGLRRRLLDELDRREAEDRGKLLAELTADWPDGRLKLYVLSRTLRFRRAAGPLFSQGELIRLEAGGSPPTTVVALGRRHRDEWVVCLVPRLSDRLRSDGEVRGGRWHDLSVFLPEGAPATWTDVLSGRRLRVEHGAIRMSEAFAALPVALLSAS